jgi:hypothetical protein
MITTTFITSKQDVLSSFEVWWDKFAHEGSVIELLTFITPLNEHRL